MFKFAWVDTADTVFDQAFARYDVAVASFEVLHKEGSFPELTIRIRNPRVGLLNAGRKQWAWLSWENPDDSTAGAVPLFFGRLVAIPEDLDREIVTLNFQGRPADYDAQKRALAETLRVPPYWDPVWIDPQLRDDPDVVLEATMLQWHIDRVSHAVTASDDLNGEDGTVNFEGADIRGSFNFSRGDPPLRRVKVSADTLWSQQATGSVEVTRELVAAARASGTTEPNALSSYTGQGLYDDWFEKDDDIGGGWKIGTSILRPADGTVFKRAYKSVTVKYDQVPTSGVDTAIARPFKVKFPRWRFIPTLSVVYEAARDRKETVSFELAADVQALASDESETEVLEISMSSSEVSELIDGEGSDATRPIGDLRRRQYFTSDRGRRSIEYLIALARAKLLTRARTANISLTTSFARAIELSCRMNATVTDARLPGGIAAGKIVAYGFAHDGATGAFTGSVQISCVIGQGNSIAAVAGDPVYVEDGVLEDGIQQRSGETVMPIAGSVTYEPLTDLPNDDGIDFFNMTPGNVIESFVVINGVSAQSAALDKSFLDITSATEALNAKFTDVGLILKPVTGGPFEQIYALSVSGLMVPKTIDLEAA